MGLFGLVAAGPAAEGFAAVGLDAERLAAAGLAAGGSVATELVVVVAVLQFGAQPGLPHLIDSRYNTRNQK